MHVALSLSCNANLAEKALAGSCSILYASGCVNCNDFAKARSVTESDFSFNHLRRRCVASSKEKLPRVTTVNQCASGGCND